LPGFFVCFGIGGSFLSFAGLWAMPYLMQVQGLSRAVAANHISLFFIGFAVGALVIGTLSDRLGRRRPVLIGGALLYVLTWLIWVSGMTLPLAASYALCAATGLFTASFTLSWACAKEVNPPALSGMATSVVNVGVFLGPALLQPLVGWAMDQSWQGQMAGGVRLYSAADYQPGLLLLLSCALLGFIATLFMRETGCRNIWRAQAIA